MKTKKAICIIAALLALGPVAHAQQTDNAALLYYQAFLVHETPDETAVDSMIHDYRKGRIEAHEQIEEHLSKNHSAIQLAVKAAEMDECDWGYDYSEGMDVQMPHMMPIRRLVFLLAAEARWLADHGDYATALDRCIALRRMADHVADRTLVTYLVGLAINALANGVTGQVLGLMPGDVKALNEMKDRLKETQEQYPTLAYTFTQEAQVCANSMRKDKAEMLISLMKQGNHAIPDSTVKRLRGDEAFFERNRKHYANAIGTIVETIESDLPYAQMYRRLDELDKEFCGQAKNDPDATLTAMSLPAAKRILLLEVREQTHVNAIYTAIDLYITRAKTGRLPKTLPAGAPVDLFSGKPFAYEKTPTGFILRCRAKEDPEKDKIYEFEFTVPK